MNHLPKTHRSLSAASSTLAAGLLLAAQVAGAAITQQAYLKASNTGPEDYFGYSVAVSGDTMVVGAYLEDSTAAGSGAAYVFVRNGTNWTQQAHLKVSNPGNYDFFGIAVAISGDTLVVAANGEDSSATGVDGDGSDNSASDSGAAYVFVRNGTNWTQQAYLKASNTDGGDEFGVYVAISGDTVVVGAPGEGSSATGVDGDGSDNSVSHAGAAYVFVRNGTTWTQQAYLKASNTGANDSYYGAGDFFARVAISGDTVVVGTPGEDSSATGVDGDQSDNSAADSGAAYVFVRSGTTWSQQAYLKASNPDNAFGLGVAVSGDTIVVGAGRESGYVFVRSGTTWSQQAYLKASNTEAGDGFGYPVAISGDTIVVGALQEDSSATGVDGNQDSNSATNSGAAYVFVRSGTTWTQQAYLKASNTGGALPGQDSGDFFGESVAISGNTIVVGADQEDSNATGVNSNQSNNSASNAGAAYVFTGAGHGTSLALAPDGSSGYFLRFTGAPEIIYRLQRAPNVTGPWSDIATNTAPASGLIEYHETTPPPGAAFYRTAQP